eukprot:4332479-Lingulodinium_polyedra.AAC.1
MWSGSRAGRARIALELLERILQDGLASSRCFEHAQHVPPALDAQDCGGPWPPEDVARGRWAPEAGD